MGMLPVMSSGWSAVAGETGGGESASGLARWAERQFAARPLLDRAWRPVKRVREKLRRLLPQRMPPLVARY